MTTRSFKNFNASAFREDLKSAPWDSLRNCTTPDEMVEIWENMFLKIADAHAPVRTRRVRNKKIPLDYYWSEGADNGSKQTEKAGYINKTAIYLG